MKLSDVAKDGIHHAYLIAGTKSAIPEVRDFVERKLGMHAKGNADVRLFEYKRFGIGDARNIHSCLVLKSLDKSGRKVVIVLCDSVATEAQHALLKTLEEPPFGAYLFIITPTAHTLLPTIHSRMHLLETISGDTSVDAALSPEMFFKASGAKRIEMLAALIEAKEAQHAISFLESLERMLYVKMRQTTGEQRRQLSDVGLSLIQARSYLQDKGASIKTLMEGIALSLPRV